MKYLLLIPLCLASVTLFGFGGDSEGHTWATGTYVGEGDIKAVSVQDENKKMSPEEKQAEEAALRHEGYGTYKPSSFSEMFKFKAK